MNNAYGKLVVVDVIVASFFPEKPYCTSLFDGRFVSLIAFDGTLINAIICSTPPTGLSYLMLSVGTHSLRLADIGHQVLIPP